MADNGDTMCICGRTFDKPFGMRVHQRSCPIERARSEAFVRAHEEGRPADAWADGNRAAREKMAELGWSDPEESPALRNLQVALLAANDLEVVEIQATITIDPKVWAEEWHLDSTDFAGIERDARSHVATLLHSATGPFAAVTVRVV